MKRISAIALISTLAFSTGAFAVPDGCYDALQKLKERRDEKGESNGDPGKAD